MTRKISTRGRTADGSPNPIDVYVGARVKMRRTLLGLSQEDLASAIGLTFQQVQKYERGLNRIGASRLFDISKVLAVSINFFFEELPETAADMSPRKLAATNDTAVLLPAMFHLEDPLYKREALELVRAYFAITDRAIAKQLYILAKTLAKHQSDQEIPLLGAIG